ncbi:MAG: SDR family NAD(P)-dependent oxidoreductase [Bacteroidia bacterium]
MNHYFITGTSSGLGKAMAEICLRDGHTVTGISRHQSIHHQNYFHLQTDLSKTENLSAFSFEQQKVDCEKIVLINNAAQIEPVKYSGHADNEDIIQAYTLNVIAPAVLINTFIATFENHSAKKYIVNISSGAANYPVDGWSVYCSSKAALDMISRTVAMEREKEKSSFKVASIAPGIVDTAMQSTIRKADSHDFSRVSEFVAYKEENKLQAPEAAAEKIISAINQLNSINDVVFSIKN